MDDADVGRLVAYLASLVLAVRQDGDADDVSASLSSAPSLAAARAFATEPTAPALFVNASEAPGAAWTLSLGPVWAPGAASALAVLKRPATLDVGAALAPQLHVVSLQGLDRDGGAQALHETPYEALERVVHSVLAPWVDAYAAGHDDHDDDGRTGVSLVRRKLIELEGSLRQVQQHAEIPHVVLPIHPAVRAACERGGTLADLEPPSLLDDDAFVNALHADTNGWVRAVQSVTRLDRDASSGTALQEASFWAAMESALDALDEQLHAGAVELTLQVLTHAKRFHATVSFHADTGLKDALDKVRGYNLLLKDLPLSALPAATSLDELHAAQHGVLSVLTRKLRTSTYPVRRALDLVDALGRDVRDHLLRVLHGAPLIDAPYATFEATLARAAALVEDWDEHVKEFVYVARDVTRKRADKFIPIKVASPFAALHTRLAYLGRLRAAHEELRAGVAAAPQADAADAGARVDAALAELRAVDVLDTSDGGMAALAAAEARYHERLAHVESQLLEQLQRRLRHARSLAERVRVLAQHHRLLARPRVRAVVQDVQAQLLQEARAELDALRRRFQRGYPGSDAQLVAQLRHEPDLVGVLLWTGMMEQQLRRLRQRMHDALGPAWAEHVDGQRVDAESAAFLQQLDPRPLVQAWALESGRRAAPPHGAVVRVVPATRDVPHARLAVQQDTQTLALAEEAHALAMLGHAVPHALASVLRDARVVQPVAHALHGALRLYERLCARMDAAPLTAPLLVQARLDVRAQWRHVCAGRWEDVLESAPRDAALPRRVDALVHALVHWETLGGHVATLHARVDARLAELQTCAYAPDALRAALAAMQADVEALALHGVVNVDVYVANVAQRVEAVLLARLEDALLQFCTGLEDAVPDSDTPVVQVVVRAQALVLEPPLEHAQAHWFDALGACVATVLEQPRLTGGAPPLARTAARATHRDLLAKLGGASLAAPLRWIQASVEAARVYAEQWLQWQVVWDVDPASVLADVAPDAQVPAWLELMRALRDARAFLDVPRRAQGLVHVDASPAQSRVRARFVAWQGVLHARFVALLGAHIRETHAAVRDAHAQLAPLSATHPSTAHLVALVGAVTALAQRARAWAPAVAALAAAQACVQTQRVALPPDWVYVEQVQGDLSAFQELLARQQRALEAQHDEVHARLAHESYALAADVEALRGDWAQHRPVSGALAVGAARATLASYAARVAQLQARAAALGEARDAFGLAAWPAAALDEVAHDVARLRDVWTALAALWDGLAALRATPWRAVQLPEVRRTLERLVRDGRALPSRVRAYDAYARVDDELHGLLAHGALLQDLHSDAFQLRHWRRLHARLHAPTYVASTHTLGDVWDLDWRANVGAIQAAVAEAQGEYALELYLQQVRDAWTGYALELVDFQHECMLLQGLDAVGALAQEHADGLAAMAASPHYRAWEEDAQRWADRVARVRTTFALWADVQRQWVYLHGVFRAGPDMAHRLPVESARFESISSEFMALVRKALRAPYVLDVLQVPGVHGALERLAELLHRLQSALGTYLERERARFPRFYFVGDDDLLEMLGHARDAARLAPHLAHMFPGVRHLVVRDGAIHGVVTPRGETLALAPIALHDVPAHEWLQALERALPAALHARLAPTCAGLDAVDSADALHAWLAAAPAQLLVLAVQLRVTRAVDAAQRHGTWTRESVQPLCAWLDAQLGALRALAARDDVRWAAEQLLALLGHQRALVGALPGAPRVAWTQHLRHYATPDGVEVRVAHASFPYGFELLAPQERLVTTPLTTASFVALTQALHARRGGAPFGPAGTGKTETVKALGAELGRWVLVFNCDEQFDERAVRRLLRGLCRVGAWGCLDEFNRLDERVLSSVSQAIQAMQEALASGAPADLGGPRVPVAPSTGLFVTMNPSYAGRSHLPDNLARLFRRVAMTRPDTARIAEGRLQVHGFVHAAALAHKLALLFRLCAEQLSDAPHYDFGLRALKAVLTRAAHLRRAAPPPAPSFDAEAALAVQSLCDTVPPRLVEADAPLWDALLRDLFPHGAPPRDGGALADALRAECAHQHLGTGAWLDKVRQLHDVVQLAHGVVLVGDAGTGKTLAWKTLLAALDRRDQRRSTAHVLDAKVLSKAALYGTLDPTTREWSDGLLTHLLRRLQGTDTRHWIVFDGDLDPAWVETLNSVLDDNRQLTLPTGERLALPPEVRFLFEVDSVAYATRATITRCGMVWFPAAAVTRAMRWTHALAHAPAAAADDAAAHAANARARDALVALVAADVADARGVWAAACDAAQQHPHIMAPSEARAITTMQTLLRHALHEVAQYHTHHPDFPLSDDDTHTYVRRAYVLATLWALAGDAAPDARAHVARAVQAAAPDVRAAWDVRVDAAPGAPYVPWADAVARVEVDARALASTDAVVPTVDTVCHEALLYAMLHDARPLLLCGPPGAGKTMVLLAALRCLPDVDVVTLNLSSQTTTSTLLRTLEAHTTYEPTAQGLRLVPRTPGRRLALFCDEINLPAPDAYGTRRPLALLRQWIEHGGFWRHQQWVALERIQVVGACNPPTDAGRAALPPRLLRHMPVVLVPYPSDDALHQIYSTMARALLRSRPPLRGYADALAHGMVTYFRANQAHLTPAQQAHYIYSPRELTRWLRGMHQLLPDDADLDELVRVWAHEAQRVFQDRLVLDAERQWSERALDDAASAAFPGVDVRSVLRRPLLYADWLSRTPQRVSRPDLRAYAQARLRGFAEEALDTDLILHDGVLDLALRCDRVLQQPAGHLLLIGVAGSGRATVARFCAWLRGLALYSLPTARAYGEARFDKDVRALLRRVGVQGERICWVLDESQMAEPARVEKLNTLLANAEVAGLFEGDEYTSLLSALRDAVQRQGLVLHADDELLAFFRAQILANLHVVLTMTPPRGDLAARAAASPALLNRCTLVYCW